MEIRLHKDARITPEIRCEWPSSLPINEPLLQIAVLCDASLLFLTERLLGIRDGIPRHYSFSASDGALRRHYGSIPGYCTASLFEEIQQDASACLAQSHHVRRDVHHVENTAVILSAAFLPRFLERHRFTICRALTKGIRPLQHSLRFTNESALGGNHFFRPGESIIGCFFSCLCSLHGKHDRIVQRRAPDHA